MYVYVYACMYVCMHVYMHVFIYLSISKDFYINHLGEANGGARVSLEKLKLEPIALGEACLAQLAQGACCAYWVRNGPRAPYMLNTRGGGIKYGLFYIFSLLNLEYVHVHVVYRVS